MRATVAHKHENVVLAQVEGGFVNFLSADDHFGFGEIVVLTVAQQNYAGIVVLDYLRLTIVDKVEDCKRRIGNASYGAYGQSCGNCFNAVFQSQAFRHHGGNDFARKR